MSQLDAGSSCWLGGRKRQVSVMDGPCFTPTNPLALFLFNSLSHTLFIRCLVLSFCLTVSVPLISLLSRSGSVSVSASASASVCRLCHSVAQAVAVAVTPPALMLPLFPVAHSVARSFIVPLTCLLTTVLVAAGQDRQPPCASGGGSGWGGKNVT